MAVPYPTRVGGGIKKLSYLFYFLFLFHYPLPTSIAALPTDEAADKSASSKLRLWIECNNLENRDITSVSDPSAFVDELRQVRPDGPGRTEEVSFHYA